MADKNITHEVANTGREDGNRGKVREKYNAITTFYSIIILAVLCGALFSFVALCVTNCSYSPLINYGQDFGHRGPQRYKGHGGTANTDREDLNRGKLLIDARK
jgi:hypothetical protein